MMETFVKKIDLRKIISNLSRVAKIVVNFYMSMTSLGLPSSPTR